MQLAGQLRVGRLQAGFLGYKDLRHHACRTVLSQLLHLERLDTDRCI